MKTLWTIAILHLSNIPNRVESYNKLITELTDQIKKCNAQDIIEILTEIDDGENSVGKKRNNALDKAKGDYICFIDDDDMITDIYVSKTLEALKENPDVVELVGYLPHHKLPFIHNMKCGGHYKKDGIQYRTPNHLNTIKIEIAKKIRYIDISHGEDQEYSKRLWESGLLKTEFLINETMYIYQFDPKKSQTTKFARKK